MLYIPSIQYPARNLRGAKRALKPFHVWGIRVRLQVARRIRDVALFDLAIDSKLRGCDLVQLRVCDVLSSNSVRCRGVIIQQKTRRPVQSSTVRYLGVEVDDALELSEALEL